VRCAYTLGARREEFPELTGYPPTVGVRLTAADVRRAEFPLALRGYETAQVDALLERVAAALPAAPAWAAEPVPVPAGAPSSPGLRTTLRGYATAEVDAFLVRCAHSLGRRVGQVPELVGLTGRPRSGEPLTPQQVATVQFRVVLRGYALDQVDALLDRTQQALEAPD